MKAIIACGHKMLRIIYKILQSHQPYNSQKALGLRQQTNALSLTIKKFFHLHYSIGSIFLSFFRTLFQIKFDVIAIITDKPIGPPI